MRRYIATAILIALVFSLAPASQATQTVDPKTNRDVQPPAAGDTNRTTAVSDRDEQLWNTTVSQYLKEQLWTDKESYDAGSYLMVPLHAAFVLQQEDWQEQFAMQFELFAETSQTDIAASRLNRLQYEYLASRFLVLAAQHGREGIVPTALFSKVAADVSDLWETEPAWQWGRSPFQGGMRERVQWKLSHRKTAPSYYAAIIDEELYVFAIAADLSAYQRLTGCQSPRTETLHDVLITANKVFSTVVEPTDTGWLFQPGIWSDHPDYRFAGNASKHDVKPSKVTDIAEDTSHSARFPLWLTSLAQAYAPGSPQREFYVGLKAGLASQFFSKVLVPPTAEFSGYRTNNFMDGRNGLYRWGYATQGPANGYGPYELSGTLTLGWWSFLGGPQITSVYRTMASKWPFAPEIVKLYVGPNTSRARNPLVVDPDSYRNGFRELLMRLGAKIAERGV